MTVQLSVDQLHFKHLVSQHQSPVVTTAALCINHSDPGILLCKELKSVESQLATKI